MKEKIVCGGIWSSVALTVGFLVLSGCGTTQNPDAGTICVDRPEVFTRQRLINRRLAEQKWLENQLDKDADFTLQGYRDVREFTGFALALKGQFDPLSGTQAESLLPDAQRNPRIGELQDELQVEVLRKQLQYVQTNDNEFLFTNQMTLTKPPAPQTNVTNPLPAASATINLNTFTTSNLPVLPNPTNRYRSGAQLTSIQTLDDKLAYRNAIQARLREQELDDTHDLLGMTLYTLKFEITVAAGENNPSPGEVKLEMAVTGEDLTTNDFENWVGTLDRELRDESVGLQQRYLMGFLTEDEKLRLMALALQQRSEIDTIAEADSKLPLQVQAFRENPTRQTALALLGSPDHTERALGKNYFLKDLLEELNRGKPGSNGCPALALVVHDRFGKELGASVALPQPTKGVSLESNVFFLVTAKKGDHEEFKKAVEQITQTAKPYVYTVEPKGYAQNISDVAAREKLISLALALSAAIPQAGASVGANTEYTRRSQMLLEAIKRQPLVVGFADGTTTFGWVVGPKFEIEGANMRFSHTRVQHSVHVQTEASCWADASASGGRTHHHSTKPMMPAPSKDFAPESTNVSDYLAWRLIVPQFAWVLTKDIVPLPAPYCDDYPAPYETPVTEIEHEAHPPENRAESQGCVGSGPLEPKTHPGHCARPTFPCVGSPTLTRMEGGKMGRLTILTLLAAVNERQSVLTSSPFDHPVVPRLAHRATEKFNMNHQRKKYA